MLISTSAIVFVIIGFTILCISMVLIARITGWDTPEKRQLWRDRSKALIADMEPGLSREQIINIAQKHGFPKEWAHERDSEMYVGTPGELGATNWVIRFGFSKDKLIYVKVRTDDDIVSKYKPKDAPDDIFYSPDINE